MNETLKSLEEMYGTTTIKTSCGNVLEIVSEGTGGEGYLHERYIYSGRSLVGSMDSDGKVVGLVFPSSDGYDKGKEFSSMIKAVEYLIDNL
jgi:hypothetical protein